MIFQSLSPSLKVLAKAAAGSRQIISTKVIARLTNMIKSGKELKVFSIPQKDLKKFTEQANRYRVLYFFLREKNTKGENAPVDSIARAEDASKIQRSVCLLYTSRCV